MGIDYQTAAFISVFILCLVHYISAKLNKIGWLWHGKFLSFAGGVSVSYVFLELIPKLCEGDQTVHFPFLEKHVFIMALIGMLIFYAVQHLNEKGNGIYQSTAPFWLSILTYGIFNFLVGYAVCDENDPEVRPLTLFTFAMGLHMFINDHNLFKTNPSAYLQLGRIIIVALLALGYVIGLSAELSRAAIALVMAFIAGGMIMNVFQHELPSGSPKVFTLGAFFYGIILLV